jgi:DNA-binding MarR family transcriptional regulator
MTLANSKELETENEIYLGKIFAMFKKMEKIAMSQNDTELNNTELRLVSEILLSGYEGKRLISTQLAKKLNVTRSAVSQIVKNLESREIVKRVPDSVDKKIAYIELTDSAIGVYLKSKKIGEEFIGEMLRDFGKKNLDKLLELTEEFWETFERINKANEDRNRINLKIGE